MLQVENLSKHYGSIKSVNDISFELLENEVVGLLGENGAGKSTTMNMLTGCLPQSSGKIIFNNSDTVANPWNYKNSIGYLPEIPPLYLDMTVSEQLDFVAAVKGINGAERRKEVGRVAELTNITHMSKRLTRNLSKGYKQRVGLAQALISKPVFLVLDEPMAGLDPRQIAEMRDLITSLDMTVIISSHILSEISAMCSRLLVMKQGEMIADARTEDFLDSFGGQGLLHIRVKEREGMREVCSKVLSSLPELSRWQEVDSEEEGCVEYTVISENDADIREAVFKALADKAVPVVYFELRKTTLEDIFIELTA